MFETERIIATAAIVWALIALIVQLVQARGKGRKDYSVRAGSTLNGVIYNFTRAMTPKHKETIRNHPIEFTIGVLMHIGIFLAIIKVLLLLIQPQLSHISPITFGVIFGIATLCALFLFLRRIFSVDLRSMSSPEDYLSILITLGFLSAAAAYESGLLNPGVFLIYAAVLFFYLPLGKLRHALFFFVARADFGARLGYRGTYPAKSGVNE